MRLTRLLRKTLARFVQMGGPLASAAMAFYVFLSAAPLTLVAVAVAGFVVGQEVAVAEVRRRIASVVGNEGAALAVQLLEALQQRQGGFWATVGGILVTLFAASQLFAATQRSLNQIWEVRLRSGQSFGRVTRSLLQKRLWSFAMVFLSGGLLLLSLALQALLRALQVLTLGHPLLHNGLFHLVERLGVLLLLAAVFACVFRVLPDAKVAWRDAWMGAGVTALLFALGAWVASLYLHYAVTASAYGAAGSLAVILLWVYYSAQMFFLGATFTQVWAQERGLGLRPEAHAVRVIESIDAI